ncbi:hypothetical protein DAI22_02g128900 [Oryza sativa Japonica Group]|nr:hypothetical protein DAI22_02g128900 [Oryza sativa Japonica Group]
MEWQIGKILSSPPLPLPRGASIHRCRIGSCLLSPLPLLLSSPMPLPSSPTTPVTPSTAPPPCRSPPQLDLLVQGSVGATAPSPTGGPAFRQRHCSVVLRWSSFPSRLRSCRRYEGHSLP